MEAAGLAGAAIGGSCAVRHSAKLLTGDRHQQIPLRADVAMTSSLVIRNRCDV
jgi:hypothetical protein